MGETDVEEILWSAPESDGKKLDEVPHARIIWIYVTTSRPPTQPQEGRHFLPPRPGMVCDPICNYQVQEGS